MTLREETEELDVIQRREFVRLAEEGERDVERMIKTVGDLTRGHALSIYKRGINGDKCQLKEAERV